MTELEKYIFALTNVVFRYKFSGEQVIVLFDYEIKPVLDYIFGTNDENIEIAGHISKYLQLYSDLHPEKVENMKINFGEFNYKKIYTAICRQNYRDQYRERCTELIVKHDEWSKDFTCSHCGNFLTLRNCAYAIRKNQ